jgi:hypothetical protein
LDFKISTLLKQYVTVVLPIWFDAFLWIMLRSFSFSFV